MNTTGQPVPTKMTRAVWRNLAKRAQGLAFDGHMIAAIRLLRTETNCSLLAAHSAVHLLRIIKPIVTLLVLAAVAVPAVAQERIVRIHGGTIATASPRVTAAEAAAIVAALPRPVLPVDPAPRGTSVVVAGRPQDGPFGPFPPQPVMAPLTCCQVYRWNLPASGPYTHYDNGPHRR